MVRYKADDTNRRGNEKLNELLKSWRVHMVEIGYVTDTSSVFHDIDQDNKKTAILSHSERIAFARYILDSRLPTSYINHCY